MNTSAHGDQDLEVLQNNKKESACLTIYGTNLVTLHSLVVRINTPTHDDQDARGHR